MALDLTTYAGLIDAVAHFLNRDDLTETGEVAGFITLAEASMRRDLRRAVTKAQLTFLTTEISHALPATVAELRSIAPAVTGTRPKGGKPLTILSWEAFQEMRARLPQTGVPRFAAVVAGSVYVAPAPSDAYLVFDITSYDKLVPVSESVTQLIEAPDLYLYGALVHSAPFLEHDERMPLWVSLFDAAVEGLNMKRQNEEFGMSLKAARLPVVFG